MITRKATLTLDCSQQLADLDMSRMALGQGGLSSHTMWESRIPEIRALRPKLIRFWIQEYFNILPAPGVYRFEAWESGKEFTNTVGQTYNTSYGGAVSFDQDITDQLGTVSGHVYLESGSPASGAAVPP